MAPDACLTPIGDSMVPVPYMIVSRLDWSQRTISDTSFSGQQAFTMASRTDRVVGNEAGTGAASRQASIKVGADRSPTNRRFSCKAGKCCSMAAYTI